MNTVLLILAACAAACGVIGGWRRDPLVLGIGLFLIAVVWLLPVTV